MPRIDVDSAYWLTLARHDPLAILTDLDGTLVPFAPTPDAARPSAEVRQLTDELARLPGVTLVIVSGRQRETLDDFFPRPRASLLVAEHGAWRSKPNEPDWKSTLEIDGRAIDSLVLELSGLQKQHPEALIERKTWSVAFHFRRVPAHRKTGLLVEVDAIVDPWVASHTEFEALAGAEVVEVRPRLARKANAVRWARELLGAKARLLIVGDDITDEDMFAAAAPEDATVLVGPEPGRPTAAQWRLDSSTETIDLYRWLLSRRQESKSTRPPRPPTRMQTLPDATTTGETFDLLVLSNRLPELRSAQATADPRKRNVGGLVSALAPVLEKRRGVWLGWSGRTRADASVEAVGLDVVGGLPLAWVDFPEAWGRHYYNGMSNGALWPLFHSFPGRVKFLQEDWVAYQHANQAFATVATRLVGREATIWVHDYHLLLMGRALRERGHRGRVGLFLHIPFPGPDIFFLCPWAREILESLVELDLVGFHTNAYAENFLRCAATLPGARIEGRSVVVGHRTLRVGTFPIGIIPEEFRDDAEAGEEVMTLLDAVVSKRRLVLGVDRLDYTKGIPERILAFGRLLELFPEWRRHVCLVQVSVPSRGDVPEYAEQRSRVENVVGRINGDFSEADWVPIRYLYRSYGRAQLSRLYRAANVGYVTPLRDGMNLVAKEYVAAQEPDDPGVLLLSQFAGAAEELVDALLTNPWYPEGMARDLDTALRMPLEERKTRHGRLLAVISKTTAITWAEDFLAALGA
jgi:alpha,alpha-trehalose-phosphate synthase [UDP-forming]/trehalose-phosphatase